MRVIFDSRFAKDVKNISDQHVKNKIAEAIEVVEKVSKLSDIPNLKKMQGAKNAYRISCCRFCYAGDRDGSA